MTCRSCRSQPLGLGMGYFLCTTSLGGELELKLEMKFSKTISFYRYNRTSIINILQFFVIYYCFLSLEGGKILASLIKKLIKYLYSRIKKNPSPLNSSISSSCDIYVGSLDLIISTLGRSQFGLLHFYYYAVPSSISFRTITTF